MYACHAGTSMSDLRLKVKPKPGDREPKPSDYESTEEDEGNAIEEEGKSHLFEIFFVKVCIWFKYDVRI